MMTRSFHDQLRAIVGDDGIIEPESENARLMLTDRRASLHGTTPAIVMPATHNQLQQLMTHSAQHGWAIVPQGGNSGLVGGSVPHGDDPAILLSLCRLNRVCEVNHDTCTITVDAGVTLAHMHEAATAHGYAFPIAIAAPHATAGGMAATNAGGQHVVRYGMARQNIVGLSVILPDGRDWNGQSQLFKDNTGYDLKQLFIGSEGTLGVIASVTFRLVAHPLDDDVAFVAVADASHLMKLWQAARRDGASMVSLFEYISHNAMQLVGEMSPFKQDYECYALLALTTPALGKTNTSLLAQWLGQMQNEGIIEDFVHASDDAMRRHFHHVRDGMSEAQTRAKGISLKHDIALPLHRLCDFLAQTEAKVLAVDERVRCITFGHFADGSLHYNVQCPPDISRTACDGISDVIYDQAMAMGGSISGEHGIGRRKRSLLARQKDAVTLALLRQLKDTLDPDGRMNPSVLIGGDEMK